MNHLVNKAPRGGTVGVGEGVSAFALLFVTDSACMTSNGVVNPSLTYMALTARSASWVLEELKRGNL